MALEFDDRPSESPYIERVWRSRTLDLISSTAFESGAVAMYYKPTSD